MDDDCKEYRRNKPQQKLYKPGSGPLRRSGYGTDSKMDNYVVENSLRNRENDQYNYGSQSSVNSCGISSASIRQKKPEQQLYVPRSADTTSDRNSKGIRCDTSSQYNSKRMPSNKQDKHSYNNSNFTRGSSKRDRSDYHNKDDAHNDVNYNNRHNRQVSEPRCTSPTYNNKDRALTERNRDTKSMETSAGRHMSGAGGKPPSGRRNSAGYTNESPRNKYMLNMDNIPPRFRKKYLEQSGHHSFDSVDQISRDNYASSNSLHNSYNQNQYNSCTNWSQTLPSRGRGRLRDNEHFDREKFMHSYMKSYDLQNSRRSTPSNSYMNLYETNFVDNQNMNEIVDVPPDTRIVKDYHENVTSNGINSDEINHQDVQKQESDKEEFDTISQSNNNPFEMTSLDWTEEVEKNIKLEEISNSTTSFAQNSSVMSINQNPKDTAKSQDSKRSGKSKRRDKRSSSRGQRNPDKKQEYHRKDSSVSLQHEVVSTNLKQRDRERRDSHKSNRSSNIGNSRDDLDRWRSIRSFSREQSVEGRIVSQCNSRDVSANRAMSPRDGDGFRVPSAVPKTANCQKKNGCWANGRPGSVERGRQSPAPSVASEAGGGGRRRRSKAARRKPRQPDAAPQLHTSQTSHTSHASNTSNWREEIIESKKKNPQGNQRTRLNSSLSEKSTGESTTSHPGLLVLPQGSINQIQREQTRGGSVETQKTLYDHHNPSKPIIVQTSPNKLDMRMERGMSETCSRGGLSNDTNDAARAAKHRVLLQEVDRADAILQTHLLCGPLSLAKHWHNLDENRNVLHNALQRLLMTDLKYCQSDNTEHQFWKILYYNFIEMLRKSLTQVTPEERKIIVELIITIIEEGNAYFENLIQTLERTYKFSTDDYINDNNLLPPKGLGYIGLALISVQKLYVFLGDLARYKEQVNETNNYAKSKAWYTKAQQINPKNGRPYNQLAILAIYARRKLDAVYYYMRSLMSSNPFQSARESLLSLFDENTKKYEAAERKRRVVQESSKSENGEVIGNVSHFLRREVWIRPGGQRTTTVSRDDKEDHLNSMTPVELNKHFITSYLHVHGKLVTKIGMESFHEAASSMLRQFRALLHRQPLPTPSVRLLQLTALNMFAIETCSRPTASEASEARRTAWLECALGVSLLMFGALLERCCALLPAPAHSQHHTDALLLLPAIKAWSDWMLCHSSIWNPPPSFENFEIETENDPWDWLAKLMNILEDLDDKTIELENEPKEGSSCVRLWEDGALAGFTPLMYMEPSAGWAANTLPHHALEHALRTRKLLFFGTEYLVGVEPPVLKLECSSGAKPRYISAVQHVALLRPHLQHLSEDSEDEEVVGGVTSELTSLNDNGTGIEGTDEATRKLLKRKEQLESRKATLEKRRQRMQEILGGSSVSVESEVRPRWLVPDTNCFIDHLRLLRSCLAAPYTLAVPLVVISELEGLCRCSRVGAHAGAALAWVQRGAPGVRLVTSRGTLLAPRGFTAESDPAQRASNDDRVLATALNLHATLHANTTAEPREDEVANGDSKSVRHVREVVLLTDDRNLRVKALAAELPTRDLPSFVEWAGIQPEAEGCEAGVAGDADKSQRQRK